MPKTCSKTLWTLALLLASLAAPAREAPAAKLLIDINAAQVRRVKLVAPYFNYPADCIVCGEIAKEAAGVVEWNLEFSTFFDVQRVDMAEYANILGGASGGQYDYPGLARLGVDGVLLGSVRPAGRAYEVKLTLQRVDDPSRKTEFAYTLTREQVRHVAHDFSNAVYKEFTGLEGIFGSRIAYVSDQTGAKEIYIAELDGTNTRQITANGTINLFPAWSPDGAKIAYTSYRRRDPDLFIYDLATGRERLLSGAPGLDIAPSWSPDGRTIAFSRNSGGDSDIYLADASTGATRRLTNTVGIDVNPRWSPNGRMLVFVSDRGGSPQVYVMDAGGGSARRLTFEGVYNTSPIWSPRGDLIAYVGQVGGSFDLFTMTPEGAGLRRLTERARDNESPTFSPDGRWIAFSSTRDRRSQLYVTSADGGLVRTLLTGRGNLTDAAWSPVRRLTKGGE
ncbi:MAG: Tol-Pal system beta propeller repeat protein TolB [Candidatus Methylomirabilis sp.]|nr:Tol-Pal system beta propeller repeat protein TolB [Deltaproteobacteria bacterium]